MLLITHCTKNEFFHFFSKSNKIYSFERVWSHLLNKYFIGKFPFFAVTCCIDSKMVSIIADNI